MPHPLVTKDDFLQGEEINISITFVISYKDVNAGSRHHSQPLTFEVSTHNSKENIVLSTCESAFAEHQRAFLSEPVECVTNETIFPLIFARAYCTHPRARVMSFSVGSATIRARSIRKKAGEGIRVFQI
jgi:hypothetical protein